MVTSITFLLRAISVEIISLVGMLIFILIVVLAFLVIKVTFPPRNFPRNIPTIPFYVSMLPMVTTMDQTEVFDRYLREPLAKYGAVNLYFALRWNVVVSRPDLLLYIFKNEKVFQKSGNQHKIPYSVLAHYTGDNVISSLGDKWSRYRKVVTSLVQHPDTSSISAHTQQAVADMETHPLPGVLQRLAMANICTLVLGVDAAMADKWLPRITAIKREIFRPIFMAFSWLELVVPSRRKVRTMVTEVKQSYYLDLQRLARPGRAIDKLAVAEANHELTHQQVLDNATILMVAGHENPQLLMMSLLFVVAKYRLCRQLINPAFRDAVICETLRMYPPLGQIVNRKTTTAIELDGILIPKGVYVGYHNYATGRDALVWERPDEFNPLRWGSTPEEIWSNFSRAKHLATLPAFHGGSRACLGQKLALFECRELLDQICRYYDLEIEEDWNERFTPAGPICPVQLSLKFNRI